MTMPYEVFEPEQLTVNGIALRGPAWLVMRLTPLWVPASTFENRVAPGVAGSSALAGIEDELRTSLPFQMTGEVDWLGNTYTNSKIGFRRNWVYLAQNLFIPDGSTATYSATYTSHDPDETPITFDIQILAPTITEESPNDWACMLQVVLPGGALIPAVGS